MSWESESGFLFKMGWHKIDCKIDLFVDFNNMLMLYKAVPYLDPEIYIYIYSVLYVIYHVLLNICLLLINSCCSFFWVSFSSDFLDTICMFVITDVLVVNWRKRKQNINL